MSLSKLVNGFFSVLLTYYLVSAFIYWMAHPELSQMEVFLRLVDVVFWRW